MKLQEIPSELKRLEPEMKRLNGRLVSFAGEKDGFLGELLRYVLVGSGKRIRPGLVHLASLLGNPGMEEVRSVALAVELIHIATLIHDDVIDRAALRRTRETVAAKFGDENAVLLGDYVYARAFQELAHVGRPQLLEMFADTTSLMCQGEIHQVQHRFQFNLSEEEYFSFIEKKTASLFESSCQAGAVLGNLEPAALQAMAQFGMHLGVAFQVADDLLDLMGQENLTGKTLRTDLVHGKMTLPLIHLRNLRKSAVEQEKLMSLLKNPDGQAAQIIQWMVNAGSVAYAQEVARRHINAALRELSRLPENPARTGLEGIALTLIDREN